MKRKDWLMLFGFILLAQGAGLLGTIVTTPEIGGWYATLVRPTIAPPNWIFGPVWTTLYTFMGIAAFLVWRTGPQRTRVTYALRLFLLQLGLNAVWSIVFFGAHNIYGALIDIALMWLAIVTTTIAFWRIERTAGILFLPYLAWVSFAAYLNYQLWVLN